MNKLKRILTEEELELLDSVRATSILEFDEDEKIWFNAIVFKIIEAIEDGKI